MYLIEKISKFNILGQIKVNNILYACGKDMAKKYDLHHWDNSHFKNFIIVAMCEMKNSVYLVTEAGKAVATFQTHFIGKSLRFEKLACDPMNSGKGIGTFCVNYIEEMARKNNCTRVCMDVYTPSQHALEFYKNRGYRVVGETNTLKYSEVKMEKLLK